MFCASLHGSSLYTPKYDFGVSRVVLVVEGVDVEQVVEFLDLLRIDSKSTRKTKMKAKVRNNPNRNSKLIPNTVFL